jgi:hypothetical protein
MIGRPTIAEYLIKQTHGLGRRDVINYEARKLKKTKGYKKLDEDQLLLLAEKKLKETFSYRTYRETAKLKPGYTEKLKARKEKWKLENPIKWKKMRKKISKKYHSKPEIKEKRNEARKQHYLANIEDQREKARVRENRKRAENPEYYNAYKRFQTTRRKSRLFITKILYIFYKYDKETNYS